ncbi:MAG: efflux RND transporter periplasmic adaptor subunit [Planctomycetes bacterium]|nr:efflux RND transporter periplasmic adaptor subunit [Planctomycetota bacterium]
MNRKSLIKQITLLPWIVLGLTLAGCGASSEAKPRQKLLPSVHTLKLVPTTFVNHLELTGSVEAATAVTLSSPAEGPVEQLAVREGDRVESGQLLLSIGRISGADADLAAAKEDWQTQQKEFERVRRLVEDRAVPGEQLDMVRAALERSSAQLSKAHQAIDDFAITAPWAGTISQLHVAKGRYMPPRTPLIEMFDPASLLLRFQVPERHAFQVSTGQNLQARFDAFPEKSIPLQVTRAWPELDRRLRSRTFEAALPMDSFSFAPGQFVRIALQLKRVEDAITIPATAIVPLPDGKDGVYLMEDGKAQPRPVKIGGESHGQLWIVQGLEVGDALIVEGQQNLKPGQGIRLVNTPKPQ